MNPHEDEALEHVLNEPLPYIEDDGFTARVMERLPARRSTLARLRILIVLCSSVLAGPVLLHKPLSRALGHAFERLAHPGELTLSPLPFASLVLLMMLLWVGAVVAQSE
jgi:hypothetical protein